MKRLFATFVSTFALLMAAAVSYAQESNTQQYGNATLEGQNDREYNSNFDLEGTPTKYTSSKTDSISVKPVLKTKQAEVQKAAKKIDEDAVSFNFLYYVIQRFKSSDIIED